MLSAKTDKRTAKRFLCKALKANHNSSPRVLNVDKNQRLPIAVDDLKTDQPYHLLANYAKTST